MNKIRILKQEVLTIDRKVVLSKDSFIQMKNITRVWFGRMPINIPYLKLALAFMVSISLSSTPFSAAGTFLFIGTLAIVGYYVYLLNHYCLSFELSSGQIYAFTTMKKEFLEESYNEVKKFMTDENKLEKKIEVNFDNCKINMIGENSGTVNINDFDNSVHNTNSNNQNSFNTTIDFDVVCDELSALLKEVKVTESENDIDIIEAAKVFAKEKDEKGLVATLKKLSKATVKLIEVSSAFATLYQFFN